MPDEDVDKIRRSFAAGFRQGYDDVERARSERDAYEAGFEAGREAAAQAIRDHADKHAPERASAMRRHLHIAARVAAGPMTDAQMVEAIRRGDFAVCRLDEAGRPVEGAE